MSFTGTIMIKEIFKIWCNNRHGKCPKFTKYIKCPKKNFSIFFQVPTVQRNKPENFFAVEYSKANACYHSSTQLSARVDPSGKNSIKRWPMPVQRKKHLIRKNQLIKEFINRLYAAPRRHFAEHTGSKPKLLNKLHAIFSLNMLEMLEKNDFGQQDSLQ